MFFRLNKGYALLITMLLLALLALIAGRLSERANLLRQQSSLIDIHSSNIASIMSARSAMLYHITTDRMVAGGFLSASGEIIPTDGRPIDLKFNDGTVAFLQDQRGLLSLNVPDRQVLGRLLILEGIPPEKTNALLDTLEDYIDTDSLRRLNGAEKEDYERLGLPPPRNDWLINTQELLQMPAWRDYPHVISRLLAYCSVRRDQLLSANAAPRRVLQARFPFATDEQIDAFILRREHQPFISAAEAKLATGISFDEEKDFFFPSDSYRLTILPKDSAFAFEYNVLLTPGGSKMPWAILDARVVSFQRQSLKSQADPRWPGSNR